MRARFLLVLALLFALMACSAYADGSQRHRPRPSPTVSATPTPTLETAAVKVVGMSAPAAQWSTRLAEVGACGVEARRIFADLTSSGADQSTLIGQAIAATMLPVISYKVPSVTTLNAGGYDVWLDNLNTYLLSLEVPVVAVFWHEPHGDMTAAAFRAGSQRFLDHLTAANVSVGPILNGWLLDTQANTLVFAGYTSPTLLGEWDFVAVDTYQSGSMENPGPKLPGRAVPLLETWLDGQGYPDLPIGVGEYNGFSGSALTYAGEQILATPEVWFGMVWNSTGSGTAGEVLTGDRLTAYQDTKADPRALHDPPC